MATLAPQTITDKQLAWLKKEKERTGNSYATIVRILIQDKINEKGK